MRYSVLFGMIGLLLFLPAAVCIAQSASDELADENAAGSEMRSDEEMADTETGGYMSGRVVSVNVNTRVFAVKSEAFDGTLYRLTVTDATTFTGCDSLSDISVGDTVSVDYHDEIAETVILEKRAYLEEEPLPELEKPLVD